MVRLFHRHFLWSFYLFFTVVGQKVILAESDTINKLAMQFENFKNQLDSIEAQLKVLQTTINEKMSSDDGRCSVRDITEAIRSHKFQLAQEKLNELADKNKISNIVHDVFAGSTVNANIILDFAKTLTDADSQYRVFYALRDEIRTSGQIDPLKLIALVEALEREQTKRRKVSPELKAKAQSTIDGAIGDIKSSCTTILKMAMIADTYRNNVEIDKLTSALAHFRTDVSNEIIEHVVDSVFGVVAAGKIIENVGSHKDIPQVITGLTAIFNRLNFAGNLNNDATLELASHLRQLQLREKYPSISQDLRQDVDKVVQQLPLCAKNLFFHTNVCLWNKGRGEYVYAASVSISHDSERRSIYTWYPGEIKEGAYWYVEKVGNNFLFKNRDHKNEYMYAADFEYNKDMRYLFTWIPGNNTDPQSNWGIELDGDYCYVKTNRYNEYLFASTVKYDQLNSFVFTWKPGTSVRSAEFQWQIRNCGQA